MSSRYFVVVALALALLGLGAFAPAAAAATGKFSLKVGGEERTYLLYVPAGYRPETPAPLLLAFHGGFGNAEEMMKMTGFNPLAEREGYIVAYPNGVGRLGEHYTWNAGTCCGYAQRRNTDDVGFVAALIDRLQADYRIDPGRIYATGVSNGAMLAYRLACELPQRLAAIAPVAGTLDLNGCHATEPIPVLHIHGTADENVPLRGGQGSDSKTRVEHRPVPETLKIMEGLHQCSGAPAVRQLKEDVHAQTYSCKTGGPLEVIYIEGGGHTWPGRLDGRRGDLYDAGLQASEVIMKFFAGQRRP